jgi:Phosphotransferase enzyme family
VTWDRREAALPTVEEMLARLGIDAGRGEPEELPHNRRLTPGVWSVRTGDDQPAVLKYLRADREPGETHWDAHWTARDQDPRRWNYWAREPLAYQHHLTDVYAEAGIRAPACLGSHVDEREALLLLEWVDGQPGDSWPVGLYAPAAEALGRAQARFLVGHPLPAFPWLSTGFLRQYSGEKVVQWELLDDDAAWQHPIVREVFPPTLRDSARFVHANRERLYRISESLPRTLCHLDFWPKNLVRRAGGQVILIDWAFAGLGSIAEDVGNLVPDACFDHFISAERLPELERVIFDGYLRGLRSAGWNDDPRLVQLGMWSSSVKYDWLTPLTLAQLGHARQYRYGAEGEIDATFKFRERSRALLFVAGWARQAIDLADQLGL